MNRILMVVMTTLLAAGAFAAEPQFTLTTERALDQLLQPKAPAPVQSLSVTADELKRLQETPVGGRVRLPSLDTGLAKSASIELRRVELYAPGARLIGGGGRALKPSGRLFFVGADLLSGVALIVDPELQALRGRVVQGPESYSIVSTPLSKQGDIRLALVTTPGATEAAPMTCELAGETLEISRALTEGPSAFSLHQLPKGMVQYQADIAVDGDEEFVNNRFGGDETAATEWVEDLFMAMNAVYERDLNTNLRIATLILRDNATDPYTDEQPSLGEFADVWFNTPALQAIDRDFTMLLSGRGISGGFSGIAWVNAYCRHTPSFGSFGSFSVNRIGFGLSVNAFADGIGHELGHNLGSFHTHCEQLANSGTDFVDKCYNESTSQNNMQIPDPDCYQGATACPVGDGTIMSYCHADADGFDGPGIENGPPSNCSLSSEFHPLIIGKLSGLIAANNPSCIANFSGGGGVDEDLLLRSGFEPDEALP